MARASDLGNISTRLQRIAKLAEEAPDRVLTSLAYLIDIDFLREAYRRTRKDGAVGVDGQTAAGYAENLEENLESLLERFSSGRYHAPPVRRRHIPKGDGSKTRPIGIPTFEDKILQRAVAMVLTTVYEQDFLDCSYGFRPGRSAHQALQALREGLMNRGGGWVLDMDIQSFFDSLEPAHLRSFLDQRVRDGVLRRAIDKWLKAGVMEDGHVIRSDRGSPQGGVVSPVLANLYLHEVLDRWFEEVVKPRLRGSALLIRYADDALLAFTNEQDARRVLAVLSKRLGRFGLTLHPEKTRLIQFQRPRHRDRPMRRERPGTFDFLGFTHFWGRSRRGYWVIKCKTASLRFRQAVKRISLWCRRHRHAPVSWQRAQLSHKLRGHYAYYGITGNSQSLGRFADQVRLIWYKWLRRRSQRTGLTLKKFSQRLLKHYPLPWPVAIHSELRVANL